MSWGEPPVGYRPCVGMALFNQRGQVFLAQRIGRFVEWGWQMPQGGIDAGEAPLDAALRELTEEIAVPPAEVALLGSIDRWLTYDFDAEAIARGRIAAHYRGQAQRWFAFRLLGPDSLIDLATAHPEFSHWQWTDLAMAVARIVPFKREVYRAVAEAFAPYETAVP